MSTKGSGASRSGNEDFHNEDAFVVNDGLGLYVVCDGAKNRPGGEVASTVAASALEEFVERAEAELGRELGLDQASRVLVEKGMIYTLESVLEAGNGDPQLNGMMTTVTMLLAHGMRGVIGHAGDSRAYLVRRGRASQLTIDHELTDDLSNGHEDAESIDVFTIRFEPGDTLILCTDGAENVVQDPAIAKVAGDVSPTVLTSRIASAAHRLDPGSDATVVVVRVQRDAELGWLRLSGEPEGAAFGHVLSYA